MANSRVLYTGDNSTVNFSVPFEYIRKTHVQVSINEALRYLNLDYTWTNDSTIQFLSAPAQDAAIVLQRVTPADARLVDFQSGAMLTESDLDLSANQNFFLAQEAQEGYTALLTAGLVRVASGNGIVETDPQAILDAMVAAALDNSMATELAQRVLDIDANGETIAELEVALSNAIDTIESGGGRWWYQAGEPIPGVGGVPDPIADGARWYDSDDDNHPYIYDQSALTWQDLLDPRIGVSVSDITSLEATVNDVDTGVDATATALAILDTTVTNHGTTTASWFTLLGAVNGAANAWILDTATVKIDSDAGDTMATRYTALTTADSDNDAAITSEATTRSNADGVTAATIALIGAKNGASTAFIMDTSTVKIASDGGDTFATRLTTLATADSDNSSAITTEATTRGDADTAFGALYGVALNVNDYVVGFAINNEGPETGEFVILADKFSVVHPSGDAGETEYEPFSVHDGAVYMDDAIIREVHFGQTAFDTGTGYWLGDVGGTPKFSIGNASGNKMVWDGTNLVITGDLINDRSTSSFTPGWTGFSSNPTGTITYIDFGNYVMLFRYSAMTGTSNQNYMTATGLPSALRPANNIVVPTTIVNNGLSSVGMVTINSSGVITFTTLSDVSGIVQAINGFVTSGSKGLPVGWTCVYPKR